MSARAPLTSKHAPFITDLSPEDAAESLKELPRVAQAVQKAYDAQGISIAQVRPKFTVRTEGTHFSECSCPQERSSIRRSESRCTRFGAGFEHMVFSQQDLVVIAYCARWPLSVCDQLANPSQIQNPIQGPACCFQRTLSPGSWRFSNSMLQARIS